jgi:N-acetylmuramoyl-L-alanine amidase
MATGADLYDLAETRDGQRYVNICVPKNDANWRGPWDCAEFMSWLVFQLSGRLYGCIDNDGNPATEEAYTGAWKRDAREIGRSIPWRQAAGIKGAMLLRYPPSAGKMGHIAVCDGRGRTMEAMGVAYGVRHGVVEGRVWHTGVLIPWLDYDENVPSLDIEGPAVVYGEGIAGLDGRVVRRIQDALLQNGIDPGPIDGDFGPKTAAAVATFQAMRGLIVDGMVGPQTAAALASQFEGSPRAANAELAEGEVSWRW